MLEVGSDVVREEALDVELELVEDDVREEELERDVEEDVEDFELVADEEPDVDEAVVRVKVRVPVLRLMLVGVARLLGLTVKDTLWLPMLSAAVTPLALARTVVARSEAVPQPYWK